MKKDSGIPKNVVNGKTDKEKIVNEEVANKRVEDENVEVEEQNSQVGKEEKREEKQFTLGNVLIPNNPSLLYHHCRFHKDLEKSSWMGNSLHFLICSRRLK